MKYFLDTEFHENFHKPLFGRRRHFIDLISIGIVAEDGREYYAVSSDFDINAAWANEWLRENVLKSIHEELRKKESVYAKTYFWQLFEPFTLKALKNLIRWHGKSNKQISRDIFNFTNPDLGFHISGYNNSEFQPGGRLDIKFKDHDIAVYGDYVMAKPKFYAYYAGYDWVVLCSLFGRMIDLPKGFPMYCIDLKQMMDDIGLCGMWKRHNCPDPEGEHNALIDARWNKLLHDKIKQMQ